jgi:hypothetical protein
MRNNASNRTILVQDKRNNSISSVYYCTLQKLTVPSNCPRISILISRGRTGGGRKEKKRQGKEKEKYKEKEQYKEKKSTKKRKVQRKEKYKEKKRKEKKRKEKKWKWKEKKRKMDTWK